MPDYLDTVDEVPGLFDCLTEVWFDSLQDMQDNLAVLQDAAAAQPVIEDEERFLDRSELRFFIVEVECQLR